MPFAWFIACAQFMDLVLFGVSGLLASRFCGAIGLTGQAGEYVVASAIGTAIAIFALRQLDAYSQERLLSFPARAGRIGLGVLAGAAAAAVCLSLLPALGIAALVWPALWAVLAASFGVAVSANHARVCQSWHAAGSLTRRVAVVGITPLAHSFIERARDRSHGVSVVGVYDDRERSRHSPGEPASVRHLADLVADSRRDRIDAIVLALPLSDIERIASASRTLRSVPADIYVTTNMDAVSDRNGRSDFINGHSVVRIATRPLDEWQMLQKTVFDRVLAAILLVLTLPLLAVIAVAIRMDSPGPVLFRQPRHGFNGTMFMVFKFRTMFHSMADLTADRQTVRGDKRITRVGRLLRKVSLDEVPQLLNVLRGEMSLVGPRPHAPNTKAGDTLFHDAVADYALRHRVKPGITGWAQVNGWRGETRTQHQIEQRVAHDLHYIDNWSLLLDFRILLLTVTREINSRIAF